MMVYALHFLAALSIIAAFWALYDRVIDAENKIKKLELGMVEKANEFSSYRSRMHDYLSVELKDYIETEFKTTNRRISDLTPRKASKPKPRGKARGRCRGKN